MKPKKSQVNKDGQKNILSFFKGGAGRTGVIGLTKAQSSTPGSSSSHATPASTREAARETTPKRNHSNDQVDEHDDDFEIIPDTPEGGTKILHQTKAATKAKACFPAQMLSKEPNSDPMKSEMMDSRPSMSSPAAASHTGDTTPDVIPDTPTGEADKDRKRKAFNRSYLSSSNSLLTRPVQLNQGKVMKTKPKKGVSLEERLKIQVKTSRGGAVGESSGCAAINPVVLAEIGHANNVSELVDDGENRGKRSASHGVSPNPKRLASRVTPKKIVLENRYTKMAQAKKLFPVQSDASSGENKNDGHKSDVECSILEEASPVKWGIKQLTDKEGNKSKPFAGLPLKCKHGPDKHQDVKLPRRLASIPGDDDLLGDVLGELKSHTSGGHKTTPRLHEKAPLKPTSSTRGPVEGVVAEGVMDENIDDIMEELRTKYLSPTSLSKPTEENQERLEKYNNLMNFTPTSGFKKTMSHHQKTSTPFKSLSESGRDLESSFDEVRLNGTVESGVYDHPTPEKSMGKVIRDEAGGMEVGFELGDSWLADMSMEEGVDSQGMTDNFAKLSPFKNVPRNEEVPAFHKFGRHTVTSVSQQRHGVELEVRCEVTGGTRRAILEGFWMDTHVKAGDVVNIIGEFDRDGLCHISDSKNLIIVNPDLLISGTSVVSGLFCMRRSVLNEIFKGCDGKNIHMLHGSILHSFFQQVLKEKAFTAEAMENVAKETLQQKKFLHEMYGQSVTAESVKEEIDKLLPQVQQFVEKYVSPHHNDLTARRTTNPTLQITDITDIEENIWSPRYGVKGKIDLTVEVKIRSENKSSWKHKLMPLELKTGRASFSAEHKGQVTLYSMMSCDRRDDPGGGLLLYLKHGKMETIPANNHSISGLIQLRNEMAHYFSIKSKQATETCGSGVKPGHLPLPINSERFCSTCPHLLNCTAYQKVIEGYTAPADHVMSSLAPETLAHLTEAHLSYFAHWCKLMHLETGSGGKRDMGVQEIWCKTATDREKRRLSIGGLALVSDGCSVLGPESFLQMFSRDPNIKQRSLSAVGLTPGESVVISAQNKTLISLATGTITDITATSVSLTTDRDLRLYPAHKDTIYRLDKVDTYNSMAINFTNLSQLMNNSPHSAKLRDIIIDKKKPEFEATLSKTKLQKVMCILKALNKPQKIGILKVLLCKDYVLIKGFPGTGKTTTIVTMVRVLASLGLSVLLTSYTHSAVDNILVKIIKHGCRFVRLGRLERIHPSVRCRSAETLTSGLTTSAALEEFYASMPIVATTCLGVGSHPIFSRRRFDVCIIDEASQVLQPACFKPLSVSDKFVLVGDPLQLPPVVQSKEARELGMAESLFARLDDTGATYELNLQYRMNSAIMRLSNELVYDDALRCGSESVAHGRLSVKTVPLQNERWPIWLQSVLSGDEGQEVIVLDTDDVMVTSSDSAVTNSLEANVISVITHQLLQCGVSEEDIGIIAPYRQQVILLRDTVHGQGHGKVEVNTVDQYQGRDKDVILISFVKSKKTDGPVSEILQDTRRLNVAVTRPRHKLILVASVQALRLYAPSDKLLNIITDQHIIKLPEQPGLEAWLPPSVSDETARGASLPTS